MAGVSGLTGKAGLAVVNDIVVETLLLIPSCYLICYSVSFFVSSFII